MIKLIKFIFKTAITLLLILIGVIVVGAIFVNPNDYKDNISSFFEKNVGYKLQINGSIRWSLTTNIEFYMQNLEINNKSHDKFSKQAVLAIKKMSIFLNPYKSLLNMKFIISKVELEGSELTILTNTDVDQKDNIDELIKKLKSNNKINKIILFDNIILKNSIINIDDQINQHFKINPFKLDAEANVDFSAQKLAITKSYIEHNGIKYYLTSEMNYKDDKISGNTKLKLLAENNNNKTDEKDDIDNILLDVDFIFDKKQIDFNQIVFKVGSGEIVGNIKILTLDNKGEFDLKIKNIEIPKLTAAFKISRDEIDSKLQDQDNSDGHALIKLFEKLQLTGHISGGNILIKPLLSLGNINLRIDSKAPGVFEINKGLLNLAKANITVDLKAEINKEPKLDLIVNSKDLDMRSVSKIFSSGVGIVDIKLSTVANNYQELLNNLTGNIDLVIANGKLIGIDLYNILTQSEVCLNDLFGLLQVDPKQDLKLILLNSKKNVDNIIAKDDITDFSVFKLHALLKNGADIKSSILLNHQTYEAQGYGVMDLPKNHLDYKINTKLVKNASQITKEVPQYMQIVPLIVNANGKISEIVFGVDTKNYLLTALKELQKVALKSKESNATSTKMEESVPSGATAKPQETNNTNTTVNR